MKEPVAGLSPSSPPEGDDKDPWCGWSYCLDLSKCNDIQLSCVFEKKYYYSKSFLIFIILMLHEMKVVLTFSLFLYCDGYHAQE
jgi:hypothetical protein